MGRIPEFKLLGEEEKGVLGSVYLKIICPRQDCHSKRDAFVVKKLRWLEPRNRPLRFCPYCGRQSRIPQL